MKLRGIITLALALACSPALAQTSPGTSPLSGGKGGTGNAFMQFTGPSSSLKTYTLPNASGTIGLLNAIQTITAAKTFSDLTLLLAGSSSGTTTLKASAAASGVLTLPAATDTIVARATTDTLTNKTIDCASNTCAVESAPFTASNASPSSQSIRTQLRKMPVTCEDYSGGCTAANIAQAMSDAATNSRCFQFNGNYTITTSVAVVAPAGVLCITGRGGLVGSAGMTGALLDIKNSNNGLFIDGGLGFDCSSVMSIPSAIKIWTDGAGGTQNSNINAPIIVNCRRGIQFGDPNYTDFIVDSSYMQGGGYTYNVAQPVAMYSSQSGLFVDNFLNHADNTNLSSTFTGTCSGTTLTAASITGFLAKDDILTGTGITTAGTYIKVQLTGTAGGAGTYTVSSSCTSSSASLTARPTAMNYLIVGGSLNVRNGNIQNSISGGKLFVARPVNSATFGYPYGRPSVTGSTIEGADIIFTSDPDGVVAPGAGAFYMSGTQGDFSANTNCYVTTDSLWAGPISVQNARLFSTGARTVANICASNSGANIYYDPSSWGTNMVQGTGGVTGGTQVFKVVNVNKQYFAASGTYTRSAGAFKAWGECVGAGGSGGGVAGVAATNLSAGGGGGGGYAGALLTAAQIGTSQTVTIGAGGTGATAGNNAGNAGGSSSIGSLVVAAGGTGGSPSSGTSSVGPGGGGGTGTTGDLKIQGGDGGGGSGNGTAGNQAFYTNFGGSSRLSGTTNATSGAAGGAAGKLYGGGGAGATSIDATSRGTNAGGAGFCMVEEYLMQ